MIMNKEDFRIEEYDGICWQDRLVNPLIKGGYDSLESAKARLEKILEEPKYHYL